MRVAIVHDWLTVHGGAENVLREMLQCFPGADVFSLVNFLKPSALAQIGVRDVRTSFLQRLPFAQKYYRHLLPLMPAAIESFDLRGYDVILSSSHAVAKGVLVPDGARHVSYIHSPPRYVWDLRSQYFAEEGIGGLKAIVAGLILSWLRSWDVATSHGIDVVLANSTYVRERIRRCYGRDSKVVHPPVDVEFFQPINGDRASFFLTGGRFVSYKRFDILVRAFEARPDLQLKVFGDGPDAKKLRAMAPPNVEFVGRVPREDVRTLMQHCNAYLYAAEEDFGIVMAEALACGAPVIAYERGGARDIVGSDKSGAGLLYSTQSVACISHAIEQFIASREQFSGVACRERALRFSSDVFRSELRRIVATSQVV